ncbi:hypothetical protein K4F52_000274 [Lecanicillium sp. MT-2017a]|nr:hypothetical protein K4F52_000274 [Lecanicillium sp. MT-2017a]
MPTITAPATPPASPKPSKRHDLRGMDSIAAPIKNTPESSKSSQTTPTIESRMARSAVTKMPTVTAPASPPASPKPSKRDDFISVENVAAPIKSATELTKQIQKTPTRYDVDAMKTKMLIDTGRCRCMKKAMDGLCSAYIPSKNSDKIDEQVTLILANPCSGEELEEKLGDLARLVHCNVHDSGEYVESRIDTWLLVLPPGADGKLPQPSRKRKLQRIIGQIPEKCTWKNRGGDPCGYRLNGLQKTNCQDAIDDILANLQKNYIDERMQTLKYNLLCHFHNRGRLQHREEWDDRLSKFHIVCTTLAEKIKELAERAKKDKQVALTSGNILTIESLAENAQTTPHKPATLAKVVKAKFDTSPFVVIAVGDQLAPQKTWLEELTDLAKSPLETPPKSKHSEVDSGYLYAYQVEGNKGCVKIGFTTRRPDLRHGEWERDCNRKISRVHTGKCVPNAYRVERLVHADLGKIRLRIHCKGCGIQHREWFETSMEEAIKAITKWSTWMMSRPYEEVRSKTGAEWLLKAAEKLRLADFEEFLDDIRDKALVLGGN